MMTTRPRDRKKEHKTLNIDYLFNETTLDEYPPRLPDATRVIITGNGIGDDIFLEELNALHDTLEEIVIHDIEEESTEVYFKGIENLTNLRSISITDGWFIHGLHTEEINTCESLEEIVLTNIPYSALRLDHLSGMKNLKYIELVGIDIRGDFTPLTMCPSLEEVVLHYNILLSNDLTPFLLLENLERLSIRDRNISEIVLKPYQDISMNVSWGEYLDGICRVYKAFDEGPWRDLYVVAFIRSLGMDELSGVYTDLNILLENVDRINIEMAMSQIRSGLISDMVTHIENGKSTRFMEPELFNKTGDTARLLLDVLDLREKEREQIRTMEFPLTGSDIDLSELLNTHHGMMILTSVGLFDTMVDIKFLKTIVDAMVTTGIAVEWKLRVMRT